MSDQTIQIKYVGTAQRWPEISITGRQSVLTYWRPDDVYVRWDGEWVYRNDPTKIAF